MTTPNDGSAGNSSAVGPYAGFEGTVGRTVAQSEPWWPPRPTAPSGAPNIVIVLVDDMGFSDIGCYGSEIDTPNLNEMAAEGIRYTNFHVAPACSPTRAALLTGINPHAVGFAKPCAPNCDPGFPGYAFELPENVTTAAEIFRDNGYATLMTGKWHLAGSHLSETASKQSWPTQRGFDAYYGILDGFANYLQPGRLHRDNHAIETDTYPDDYFITDDLTDEAIRMVKASKASDPAKPFFLYVAYNAPHAPFYAKPADMAKYRGVYDAGWDRIREERFRRQIEMDLLPPDAVLPPRNAEPHYDVKPWDELSDTERDLFARYMELYAAIIDNIDQNVGRLRRTLAEMGELDNTIMMFASDNGATYEGGDQGSTQYWGTIRNILRGDRTFTPTDLADDLGRRDLIGGPRTHCHYPRGWGMVGNAPFRLYKGSVLAGGHQVPLIFSWPRGVEERGTFRSQYVYVTDILPTLLELVGFDVPTHRYGQPVKPITGTSFVSVLRNPAAPPTHHEQYFESRGSRGFYRDGWETATIHQPRTHFSDDDWQLYHLDEDPTESRNVAAEHPGKVKELTEAWDDAAWANQVFPLDEGSGLLYALVPPYRDRMLQPVTIYPGTPTLERYRASVLIGARSFTVDLSFEFAAGDQGILVAHGDQCGGYAFYVEDDELCYVHNGYGEMQHLRVARLEPGPRHVKADFTTIPDWNWTVTVLIDGNTAGELASAPMLWGVVPCEGIDIGIDRRSPVSWDIYERHGAFPFTGRLASVTYTPGTPAPYAPHLGIDQLRALGRQFD